MRCFEYRLQLMALSKERIYKPMFFSVVIPAYNAQKYLYECLASLDVQSFQDFEIIAVDDASTDDTPQILDTCATFMPRLSVVHNNCNKGVATSRRVGFRMARGRYITCLDADDTFHPDLLERVHQRALETNAEIISVGIAYGGTFDETDTITPLQEGFYDQDEYAQVKATMCSGLYNSLCSKVIARERLLACITDEADFQEAALGEDALQLFPVIDCASSAAHIKDALYLYRPTDGSTMHSYKPSQAEDAAKLCECFRFYAHRWGGECPTIAKRTARKIIFDLLMRLAENEPERTRRLAELEHIVQACSVQNADLSEPASAVDRCAIALIKGLQNHHFASVDRHACLLCRLRQLSR